MKTRIFSVLMVAVFATSVFGQSYDMFSLEAPALKTSGIPEGAPILTDDFDTLFAGALDGQISGAGVTYGAFDATADDVGGGDIELSQINTFVDDGFFAEMTADWSATVGPQADDGFVLSITYELTDLATDRFYTPIAANEGFIFTRCGDADNDGDWDVLDTDGGGGGIFVDTGVAIDLMGTIEFQINDLDLVIVVNGTTIFTGGIIGANGDFGIIPGETLTNMNFDSTNNMTGLNSVQNISKVEICPAGGCTVGCAFAPGDTDNNGDVDLLDVAPFVAHITNGTFACEADIDGDGVVGLLDVQPFVAILTGG